MQSSHLFLFSSDFSSLSSLSSYCSYFSWSTSSTSCLILRHLDAKSIILSTIFMWIALFFIWYRCINIQRKIKIFVRLSHFWCLKYNIEKVFTLIQNFIEPIISKFELLTWFCRIARPPNLGLCIHLNITYIWVWYIICVNFGIQSIVSMFSEVRFHIYKFIKVLFIILK